MSYAAVVLVLQRSAAASPRVFVIIVGDQYRHVARAHSDHLEHAVARLHPEHVAAISADNLGLDHLIGSLGLFALMFLVFVRLIPVVSMHEVRKLVDQEGAS